MLRQYELVDRVLDYDPQADEALLNRAYVFSMQAHGSQKRASGDPYFSHPIEVAGILTDLRLDDETIATAILHDTVEDTVATSEEIERVFGPSVARLVGSDIAHAVPLTLVAGLGHLALGSVDFGLLVSLLLGSVPGIVVGSLIASRVREGVLTPILAATLMIVGVRMLF